MHDRTEKSIVAESVKQLPRRIGYFLSMKETKMLKDLILTRDFDEAQRRRMNAKVQEDAEDAIGGRWNEIGKLQLKFLEEQGMQPSDKLLDVGCGTLRAGIHFIDYLKPEKYSGMDISDNAIDAAGEIVKQEDLQKKKPNLLVNKDLKFNEFNENFDYIIAHSLCTHLPAEKVTELFSNVRKVMTENSEFYATFNTPSRGEDYVIEGPASYRYSAKKIIHLAEKNGLTPRKIPSYSHPRGQKMFKFKLREEGDEYTKNWY